MPASHIGSVLILLLRDDTGSVAQPALSTVADFADLQTLYPDGFCETPESTLNFEATDLEIKGQSNDGLVAVAETRKVKPKFTIEADTKDITDELMELLLGEDGSLDIARTYKFWAFIAICNPDEPLAISESAPHSITAKRLIRCYLSVTLTGSAAHNGEDLSSIKVLFTVDLTKPSAHAKTLAGAAA